MALVALCAACSGGSEDVGSGDETGDGPPPRITTTTTDDVTTFTARTYRPGDCVTYDATGNNPLVTGRARGATDLTVTKVVPCRQPHFYEITGGLRLPDRGGYPTEDEWDEVFHRSSDGCKPLAERYLGSAVDPYGRFLLTGITPSPAYWAQGSRHVWCALTSARDSADDVTEGPVATEGSACGQNQSRLYAPGTCLAYRSDALEVGGPVACDKPHGVEVTGWFSIADQVPDRPTTATEWWTAVGPECTRLAETHVGRALDGRTERASYFEIRSESWSAGRREVQCLVSRYDAEGQRVVIEGLLRDQPG